MTVEMAKSIHSDFPTKTDFDISNKLSPKKWQSLFSGENKKNYFKMSTNEFLQSLLRI